MSNIAFKGWVYTDASCPTPGCVMPLMRSRRMSVTRMCAICDINSVLNDASDTSSPSVTSASRSSTPPTEISSVLSSPTFALPVDTEESLRRRQQSDTASAEIGNRLLKGWAMLADECPNASCYGVPLVRPPKSGADQDPRKECVICGTVYVNERGAEQLASLGARRQTVIAAPGSDSRTTGYEAFSDGTSKVSPKIIAQESKLTPSSQPVVTPPPNTKSLTTGSALEVAAQSLQLSLHTLSERLTSYTSGQATANSETIAQTADAIGRATYALSQVKQLQWSQIQRSHI